MAERIDPSGSRRGLAVARELASVAHLADFPGRSATLLRNLIPCDHAGYNAIDLGSQVASVVADPADVVFDGGPEALARLATQNPLVVQARAGAVNALRLSNHISRRDFHRTDLYNEVYRRIGLEHQLVVQLPPVRRELGRPHEMVGLSLARSGADFSDGELMLLEAMRPVFASTLARLHELALLRAVVDGRDGRRLVVLVGDDDMVAWASPGAAATLGIEAGERLPPALRAWLVAERCRPATTASASLTVDGRVLRGRLVPAAYPSLDAVWLTPGHGRPDPAGLRAAGLTGRQAEVAVLVAAGHRNAEIARRLELSPRTVEKHLQAVYERLGVHSRAQAVAALAAMAGP